MYDKFTNNLFFKGKKYHTIIYYSNKILIKYKKNIKQKY